MANFNSYWVIFSEQSVVWLCTLTEYLGNLYAENIKIHYVNEDQCFVCIVLVCVCVCWHGHAMDHV